MNKVKTALIILIIISLYIPFPAKSQTNKLSIEVQQTMLSATRYMVDSISTNGGYLWNYLPDKSRQWGEMEAYNTMIWLQHPGTLSMGNLFLDAYKATGNEYYYLAAQKAAAAVIWGQSPEGGWNYLIDFAGDRSLKHWYNTIGKNGWRMEEFQHYYGNATFDDDVTVDAAGFLLRIYLEKLDPCYKPALDKAIDFILASQYPLGGWPQRFPLKYDFNNKGHKDYTSYFTFNDDVTYENIQFLIKCYLTLGQQRFLEPITRGMHFYVISQDGSGGWAQQLTTDCKIAGARSYELEALLPGTTIENAAIMLRFYAYTGDKKFISRIPDAISWLEQTRLPDDKTENGIYTHPMFVEPITNKPIYVHRKGSNVKYGYYYSDYNDSNLLIHYKGKCRIPIDMLKAEYERLVSLPVDELTKDSPLKEGRFTQPETPQKFYPVNRTWGRDSSDEKNVEEIIATLDKQNRWVAKHVMTSNKYIGDGTKQELTDEFSGTFVGDNTDTSPFIDTSDQEYVSTALFIKNMRTLINYLNSENKRQ